MLSLPKNLKFFVFVVFAFTVANVSASDLQKSFLWKIQSNKNTLYLLGSVHMASKKLYPLSKIIEDSFAKASVLAVELNENKVNPEAMQQTIVNQGMYRDGDSIKAHISTDLFNLLEQFLSDNKIQNTNLYKYKPGILSMVLSSIHARNLGYTTEFGIDHYFINKAEQQNKLIVELESMEEQLSLFVNMPNQSLMLQYTLDELSTMNDEFDDMLKYWKYGDHKKLNELTILEPLQKHPELEPIFEKLFFARNRRMTASIVSFLESKQTYFVIVGAGHLIGSSGILELLRKRHYSVKQL